MFNPILIQMGPLFKYFIEQGFQWWQFGKRSTRRIVFAIMSHAPEIIQAMLTPPWIYFLILIVVCLIILLITNKIKYG